ncbi:MAG: alpha-N-arabinofuranosidase [Bacteroidales bacterium]|nr:alpha-N-arabinofuranosidase [Bacteroidales bacterium]
MKKLFTLTALLLCLAGSAQNASICFDINRKVGDIDKNIYGMFMEPIARARSNSLYGPVYDPSSPLANADGFKTDVIDMFRELKAANMRWPGGNYTSNYHWTDGIGPKEQRPVRIDPAWGGIDSNHVGTHEWVALNEAIGSANVACFNFGFGTIDEAKYWVEYCNRPVGTYYSDLRAANGHPEPFNIQYWCLGNEVDGKPWIHGYKEVDEYVTMAYLVAKIVRSVDRNVKLVACGASWYDNCPIGTPPHGHWIDWNRTVIQELYGMADYLSVHRYWEYSRDDYYELMADNSQDVEDKIVTTQHLIDVERTNYPQKRRMYISMDEWNANNISGYTQVLANAMYLNSFIRHSDIVKMANFALMTSLLQTDPATGNFYRGPLFQAYKLFSNNCYGSTIDSYVTCGTYDGQVYKNVPYLDVTCVYSEDEGRVVINVVNVNKDQAIKTDISALTGSFSNKATVSTICCELDEEITKAKESTYVPKQTTVNVKDGKLTYSFPAHSITQISIPVK